MRYFEIIFLFIGVVIENNVILLPVINLYLIFFFLSLWRNIFFHCLLFVQKRKRKCIFNQGELDALQYHAKVSLN